MSCMSCSCYTPDAWMNPSLQSSVCLCVCVSLCVYISTAPHQQYRLCNGGGRGLICWFTVASETWCLSCQLSVAAPMPPCSRQTEEDEGACLIKREQTLTHKFVWATFTKRNTFCILWKSHMKHGCGQCQCLCSKMGYTLFKYCMFMHKVWTVPDIWTDAKIFLKKVKLCS